MIYNELSYEDKATDYKLQAFDTHICMTLIKYQLILQIHDGYEFEDSLTVTCYSFLPGVCRNAFCLRRQQLTPSPKSGYGRQCKKSAFSSDRVINVFVNAASIGYLLFPLPFSG